MECMDVAIVTILHWNVDTVEDLLSAKLFTSLLKHYGVDGCSLLFITICDHSMACGSNGEHFQNIYLVGIGYNHCFRVGV